MTAQTILDMLHRRGVTFSIDGDMLRTRGPVDAVTPADLEVLREHKAEAMAIIRDEEADRIEERAAIIEFESRPLAEPTVPRAEAERRATAEILEFKPRSQA